MTTSTITTDSLGRRIHTSLITIGFIFSITHSDGYIANEKVSNISRLGGRFYYTCESCACYSESDLKNI